MVWIYAGNALWVVALAIIFGASRQAWRRTRPGMRVPVMGQPLPRAFALWTLPAAALLFGLWLALEARIGLGDPDLALIFFGIRAVSASLVALLHLRWLRAGLSALERDGALKP